MSYGAVDPSIAVHPTDLGDLLLTNPLWPPFFFSYSISKSNALFKT